jgi:hypothetical protein
MVHFRLRGALSLAPTAREGGTRRLVVEQEASGTRAVWKDVYQLMECISATCTNRGFSCWRHKDKHHKLDSDIMDRLVDRAEEGYRMDTHDDVPEDIRELLRIREDEEEARRKRKRKASDPLPVSVRVSCDGHRDGDSVDCSSASQIQLNFPVPDDEAPIVYSNWLSAKVTSEKWRTASQLAGEVTIDHPLWLISLVTTGCGKRGRGKKKRQVGA